MITGLKGEVAAFKVWPCRDLSHCYWLVVIFKSRGWMRKGFHLLNLSDDNDDRFGAIVMPMQRQVKVNGRWRNDKEDGFLGYVLFAQTQLTMETISHEAVHMSTGLIRRHGGRLSLGRETGDTEEGLAYFTGQCARMINNKLHSLGLYK